MPYFETGSAPDVNNMMGKLRTALASNGWTVNYNDEEGSSGGYRCHVSKAGMTVNLRTGFFGEVPVALAAERSARQGIWNWDKRWGNPQQFWRPNWIALNVGTGVNLSSSWHNQPGAPGASESKGLGSMITAVGGISRYWLFIWEDPDTVILICETRPNKFEHIAFGRLSLVQTIQAGGEWYFGSRTFNNSYSPPQESLYGRLVPEFSDSQSTAMVRLADTRWLADDKLDGWNHSVLTPGVPNTYGSSNWWASLGIPTPDSTVGQPSNSGFDNAVNASYLEQEGRSILSPIAAYKGRKNGGYTLLGNIGHIARTSLKAYVAGDAIAGVGETYLAFPSHQRLSPWNNRQEGTSPTDPADESYNYFGSGIAVRRP